MPLQLTDMMDTAESAARCPCCHASVHRIRRTLGDRMISLFRRVHRFRCDAIGCGWEGALRAPQASASADYRSRKIRS